MALKSGPRDLGRGGRKRGGNGWLSTLRGVFYSRLLCDLYRYGPLCGVLFLICQTVPSTQPGHSKERVSRNRTITGEEGVPSRSNLLYLAISPAIYVVW